MMGFIASKYWIHFDFDRFSCLRNDKDMLETCMRHAALLWTNLIVISIKNFDLRNNENRPNPVCMETIPVTTVNRNCLAENSGTCFQMSSKLLDIFFSWYYSLIAILDQVFVQQPNKIHMYLQIYCRKQNLKYIWMKNLPPPQIYNFARPSGIPEYKKFLKFLARIFSKYLKLYFNIFLKI